MTNYLVSAGAAIIASLVWSTASQSAQQFRHTVSTVGPEEVYLSADDMNCGPKEPGSRIDVTDVPVTAFRRSDGSVLVIAGNQNNYYLEGPSVDQARRRSCDSLVESVNDPDPASFNGRRWVTAVYAKSYDFTIGFVHHEYHGSDFFQSECQVTTRFNFECWYGSTTLVVSGDGGFSFTTPPHPDNVLAALPFEFTPGKRRAGVRGPKVVGNPKDGFVYVLVGHSDRNRNIGLRHCLLRGSGLTFNDWRAWDGVGFNLDMESPYAVERSAVDCTPVIAYRVSSVKYIPAIDRFVALGFRRGKVVYSFSPNLLSWSKPQVLMEAPMQQGWKPGMEPPRSYWSLLDSESSSINFDTLEKRPYLYFVQWRVEGDRIINNRRDVYRVPIRIE